MKYQKMYTISRRIFTSSQDLRLSIGFSPGETIITSKITNSKMVNLCSMHLSKRLNIFALPVNVPLLTNSSCLCCFLFCFYNYVSLRYCCHLSIPLKNLPFTFLKSVACFFFHFSFDPFHAQDPVQETSVARKRHEHVPLESRRKLLVILLGVVSSSSSFVISSCARVCEIFAFIRLRVTLFSFQMANKAPNSSLMCLL